MSSDARAGVPHRREPKPTITVGLDEDAYRLLARMADQWGAPPDHKTTPRNMLDHIVRSYYQSNFMDAGGCMP